MGGWRGASVPAGALIAGVACVVAGVACSGSEPASPRPRSPFAAGETVPAIAATPVPTVLARGATVDPLVATRSALDMTISSVSHEDVAAVAAAVSFKRKACDPDVWPSAACPPWMPAGTEVPVFPYVACVASYANTAELEGMLVQVLRGRGPELFALVRSNEAGADAAFPLGPYVAVFRTKPPSGISGSTGVLIALDEAGRVLSLRTGCRATPEQLLASVPVNEVLIPPQT